MTYTMYMHDICITYTSFSALLVLQTFSEAINTGWFGNHVCSMDFQDNNLIAPKRHDLLSDRIYQGYPRYIPAMLRTLASLLSRLEALDRDFLDLLCFGHREAAHARLGLSKVSQPGPGVDLVNMAAPPWGRARTIGTAALRSVPLLAAVLMWNNWGCISVQKWFQLPSSEVPQRGWRKPDWVECPSQNSCSGHTYSTGGCCLARWTACPDTLRCCCFRGIMSRPGAEPCSWQKKCQYMYSLYTTYSSHCHVHDISKYYSWHIKMF